MSDKYDEAIAYLTEHPVEIEAAWLEPQWHKAGCLFALATPSGDSAVRQFRDCGCLTTIRSGHCGHVAWTPRLTEEIFADERIPDCVYKITVEDLPVFAEWQRRLDREIRNVPQ